MPLVYNTTTETVKVRARGNWFEFKANQVKSMDDSMAHFLCADRKELGFMPLPDVCISEPDSAEAKQAKESARITGINNRILELMRIIRNLEVSLQKDLDIKGMKMNAKLLASDGEMAAYRELAGYKKMQVDEEAKKLAEIEALSSQIKASTGE